MSMECTESPKHPLSKINLSSNIAIDAPLDTTGNDVFDKVKFDALYKLQLSVIIPIIFI